LRFIDPDGMISRGFFDDLWDNSDDNTTWTNNGDGSFLGSNGNIVEEEDKGKNVSTGRGGGDDGTPFRVPEHLQASSLQNASISQGRMDYFSREDKAAQTGVNMAGAVEGGYSLVKVLSWLKGLKALFGSGKDLNSFSGVEKAWQSGATPNSIYTYLSSDGKAVSNYIYNAEGKVIYQVDFGKHGKFLSGHGHEMSIPGKLGSGHTSHIPFNQVNPDYFKIPLGVQYSTPPGF
jgi:hypothetical protein